MKVKPPTKFVKGKIKNLKRYIARIKECEVDCAFINFWEFFGDRKKFGKEFNGTVCVSPYGSKEGRVTKSGKKFTFGGIAEIWTWQENGNERLHIRVTD